MLQKYGVIVLKLSLAQYFNIMAGGVKPAISRLSGCGRPFGLKGRGKAGVRWIKIQINR